MAVRTVERGYDKHVRTYATALRAEEEALVWAGKIQGMVNIRVVPVECDPTTKRPLDNVTGACVIRYTAIFSCFSDESDIFVLARQSAKFGFTIHR
jgi:hypothetical protein